MTVHTHRARGLGFLRRFFKGAHGKNHSHKNMYSQLLGSSALRSYMVMPGQPVWMDRDYSQFAHEAYVSNVIAHRAMDMVCSAAASVKLKLNAIGPKGA